jgi:ribosome-associated protein
MECTPSLKSEPAQPESQPATADPIAELQRLQHARAAELAVAIARAADAKKAEDIVILDISRTLGIADFFVIATARGRRQVAVVAEGCEAVARKAGAKGKSLEGTETGWVVGDFSDVVLHVFEESLRGFYDLENLWSDAPRLPWTPETPAPHATAPVADSNEPEDEPEDESQDEPEDEPEDEPAE